MTHSPKPHPASRSVLPAGMVRRMRRASRVRLSRHRFQAFIRVDAAKLLAHSSGVLAVAAPDCTGFSKRYNSGLLEEAVVLQQAGGRFGATTAQIQRGGEYGPWPR